MSNRVISRIVKPQLFTPENLARKVYDAYAGAAYPWGLLSELQRRKLIDAAETALERLVSDGVLGE